MQTVLWIVIFFSTFLIMEFNAWFTHKYIMHGFLWTLHRDHHHKDHKSWFERNDAFFIFYAVVSMSCWYFWSTYSLWYFLPIGIGIMAYGLAYFIVHDVFIHQRFKWLRNIDNAYARGVRRAHKIHHKHLGKNKGENFGMLIVPFKYFKN
ncbi:beta-carotene hydroxylase [Paucihalobacter sp.]|uniref:beta-carotene hydroxylase n=1 Tax=Paucihalobacter sp. TaxID=2850405 RepID=UPI002FE24EA9